MPSKTPMKNSIQNDKSVASLHQRRKSEKRLNKNKSTIEFPEP